MRKLSPKVFSLYVYAATERNLSGKVVTKFCAPVLHHRTNIAAVTMAPIHVRYFYF
jgi:hypothetical protein